ncbi:MAG: ABC transporter permease, partial [Thermoplasmata archaeon]
SLAQRYARHPFGLELWVGIGILLVFVAAALSALVVFAGSLGTLAENPAWQPGWVAIGPSWQYPFGILSGFGVNLLDAVWQATPWDLTIVLSILAIDAGLGVLLGATAALTEGRWPDTVISFVSDSLGSIPSVFLDVNVYLGITIYDPGSIGLPLFVLIFGLLLWPTIARTVRARVRVIAQRAFVESARASGASRGRILTRHVLPNALSPALAQVPIDVAAIFLVLTFFPYFYNCGPFLPRSSGPAWLLPNLAPVSPLPSAAFPEWGFQLAIGACETLLLPGAPIWWWEFFFPLLAIVALGLGLALAADGLDRWLRSGDSN